MDSQKKLILGPSVFLAISPERRPQMLYSVSLVNFVPCRTETVSRIMIGKIIAAVLTGLWFYFYKMVLTSTFDLA